MDLQQIFTEAVHFHSSGQQREAKGRYQKILQTLPDNVSVLGNLAIVCRDLEKLDEALDFSSRALKLAPDDPAQYLNLGAVHEARDELDKHWITGHLFFFGYGGKPNE